MSTFPILSLHII